MYCTEDCTCSLCRELRGYQRSDQNVREQRAPKPPKPPKNVELKRVGNSNFILRRRKSDEDNTAIVTNDSVTSKTSTSTTTSSSIGVGQHYNKPAPAPPKRVDPIKRELPAAPVQGPTFGEKEQQPKHKVIIYFGDSLSSKQQLAQADRIHQLNQANESKTVPIIESQIVESVVGKETVMQREDLPDFVESVVGTTINVRIEGSFARAMDIVNAVRDDIGRGQRRMVDDDMDQRYESNDFDWSFVQNWRSR